MWVKVRKKSAPTTVNVRRTNATTNISFSAKDIEHYFDQRERLREIINNCIKGGLPKAFVIDTGSEIK